MLFRSTAKTGLFSGLTGTASASSVGAMNGSNSLPVIIMMALLFLIALAAVILVATGKIKFDFAPANSNDIVPAEAQNVRAAGSDAPAGSEGSDA